jgi:hypothetical protein
MDQTVDVLDNVVEIEEEEQTIEMSSDMLERVGGGAVALYF